MATPEMAARSTPDVSSLVSLFLGKSSTSTTTNSGGQTTTGTVTDSRNVSPEAVDAVVKSILEGTQGLAAVSSGQNKVGLYNSSTNRLLTNDLIARAAAEGAKLNETVTRTTNQTVADDRKTVTQQSTPAQIAPSKAALGLGLLQMVPKDVKDKLLGMGKTAASKAVSSFNQDDGEAVRQAAQERFREDEIIAQNAAANQTGVSAAVGDASVTGLGGQLAVDSTADVTSFVGPMQESFDTSFANDFSGFLSGGEDFSFDPDMNVDVSIPEFDYDFFDPGFGTGADFGSEDLGLFFAEGGLVSAEKLGFKKAMNVAEKAQNGSGATYISRGPLMMAEGGLVNNSNIKEDWRKRIADLSDDQRATAGNPLMLLESMKQSAEIARLFDLLQLVSKDTAGAGRGIVNPSNVVPGFADGGLVDLTNTGLRNKGVMQSAGIAPTSNAQTVSDAIVKSLTPARPASPKQSTSSQPVRTNKPLIELEDGGDANPTNSVAGTTPGVAPNAGIGGLASASLQGAGMVAGVPGIGLGIGMANAQNNNQAVAAFGSSLGGMIASSVAGPVAGLLIGAALKSALSSKNSDPTPSTAATADNTDGDGVSNMVGDPEGIATAEGLVDGVVDTGGDSGGGVSDSGGAAPGVGAAAGGYIQGPGTETSDSIPARLSDNEYVLNAEAVKLIGVPFLEAINNAGKRMMAKKGKM